MKTTLPLLTLAAALLAGCAATVPVKGIIADRSVEQARTKAPVGEECAPILSWFGDSSSISGKQRTIGGVHDAFDLVAPIGTNVIAAAPGIVVLSEKSTSGGEVLRIEHGTDKFGNKIYSGYAHLQTRLAFVGETVNRGQLIGRSGDTGTGMAQEPPHLHFVATVRYFDEKDANKIRGGSVSPNPFLYPMSLDGTGKAIVPTHFPKWNSAQDYGDNDWAVKKQFTGFTFPMSCAGVK
jgi:murein DD-endopeptidase MepM/ murein hydrolase activator NlpD